MAKQAIALRLEPELIAWVDAYAKGRDVSRQVVLEGAVKSFRGLARGGVPDLEPIAAERVAVARRQPVARAPRSLPPGVKTASELAMERMHKMNPERYGS